MLGLGGGNGRASLYGGLLEEGLESNLRNTKAVLVVGANWHGDLDLVRRAGLRSYHAPIGAPNSRSAA